MAAHPDIASLAELPADQPPSPIDSLNEKHEVGKQDSSPSLELDKKLEGDNESQYEEEEEARLVNGEHVITTGRDVSRYLIDIRDDRDPALTFRSLFLGTVFAGLGAALCQVRTIPA